MKCWRNYDAQYMRASRKPRAVHIKHVFSAVVFNTEMVLLNSYRFVQFSERNIRLCNMVSSLIQRLVLRRKYIPDIIVDKRSLWATVDHDVFLRYK